LTASELALTLLHCDKVCVFTQDAHIAAAPVTFALWALIVPSDNGLNGSSEIDAAGRFGVARLVPSLDCETVACSGYLDSWEFPDGCRQIER
jgi:hypothetical protein